MTTYTLIALIAILFTHFCGDFMFQTRMMGLNKGKSLYWLTIHVLVYTICLTVGTWIITQNALLTIEFALISGAIHWVTDYVTSRGSGYCFMQMTQAKEEQDVYRRKAIEEGKTFTEDSSQEHKWQYWFWSVIGIDQFFHAISLIVVFHLLS